MAVTNLLLQPFALPTLLACGWEACTIHEGDAVHLLYLDDPGSTRNASDRHVILAGLAVYERLPYWFSGHLDALAREVRPEFWRDLEFRGVNILAGRTQWRKIPREVRTTTYLRALRILGRSTQVRLFGAAIHKARSRPKIRWHTPSSN